MQCAQLQSPDLLGLAWGSFGGEGGVSIMNIGSVRRTQVGGDERIDGRTVPRCDEVQMQMQMQMLMLDSHADADADADGGFEKAAALT